MDTLDSNDPGAAEPAEPATTTSAANEASNAEITTNAPPLTDTLDAEADAAVPRRRRGHRAASSIWRMLTLDASPHLAIASVCRHCSVRVPHHHKSEKARAHLMRCAAFREALTASDLTDFPRPDWLPDATSTNRPRPNRPGSPHASTNSSAKRLKSTPLPTTTTSFSVAPPDPLAVLDALAMFIYTTGSPLHHIENPHLRRALTLAASSSSSVAVSAVPRTLRAADLTGAALERACAAVQCELLRVTQRTGAVNALCVNSWVSSESVYVVGDAAQPLFVETAPPVADEDPASAAAVLFDRLARALPLCGDNLHGIVTDNSHANQRTWAKFKTIFPAKFFHGCAAHGLYRFVGEIFGVSSDDDDEHRNATVFADLRRLVDECREIVAFFDGDDVPQDVKARLAAKLTDARTTRLAMPRRGEWFQLKAGFESVLVVLPLLQDVTSVPDFRARGDKQLRERIATLVNRSDLEALLFKAVALVDPLDTLLRRLEREPATPISDVFYWFAKELPVALSRVPGLSEAEAAFLLQLNQNRFNAMYGDSHGMAYLLDPRYVGEGLSPDVRKNIEDLVFQAPLVEETATKDVTTEDDKIRIAQQLTEYVIDATKEKTDNSFRYSILANNKKSVLQYWLSDGARWPLLQRLATKLFALPASTLPMTRRVLAVPLQLPREDLPSDVMKKIKFIQLNQALLTTPSASASGGTTP